MIQKGSNTMLPLLMVILLPFLSPSRRQPLLATTLVAWTFQAKILFPNA